MSDDARRDDDGTAAGEPPAPTSVPDEAAGEPPGEEPPPKPKPLRKSLRGELIQPFIDLIHAPRALWGVNLAYVLEGLVYFGMLGYLAMHFSDFIFQGVPHPDEHSHSMVMVLTAGITISMFVLGFVADKKGVRFALISAFILLLAGRILISAAPTVLGLEPAGLWSPLHLVTMGGILLVVIGYGMYQPAAYAAVRQFTTPKTAGMAFAMLYALMNLGGWIPTFAFLLRDDEFAGLGIPGVYWVYTALTAVALVTTVFLLTRKTVDRAVADAKAETERIKTEERKQETEKQKEEAKDAPAATGDGPQRVPLHLWGLVAAVIGAVIWRVDPPVGYYVAGGIAVAWVAATFWRPAAGWLARHPLADARFFFFIFALIPVQTLFTYNWLILPQYINRAYEGWVGDYFEIASNANPILIFIAVPIIAALTQKAKVYQMMIVGTAVMALPAFILAVGPYLWALVVYLLVMTIGEAMWQPRFLQYAAEIAPKGRTGVYMGVAQLPWFLTKLLVPWLYSGWMMDQYCPEIGPKNTEMMWVIFGCIAIASPILLAVAKGWVGKGMKERAAD
ncbi:MAG: MFS transporter [Deltaproteobacteria bacterium]|nr:MFS transporter [Deltaproteobacteria bacterium]